MRVLIACVVALLATSTTAAQHGDEQFEKTIRPVLVEHCYKCHNSHDRAEGELVLDHRKAMRDGGESGALIIPGKPEESLLISVLRHEIDGYEMPEDGPRLDDRIVAEFADWIRRGAYDPRDQPPSAEQIASLTSWETIREKRKQWWSFQPIRKVSPPDSGWSDHPVDCFIARKLTGENLKPAVTADRRTLIRRLSFALTGLPPTPDEVADFLADESSNATERLIDRLLESDRFGERWARHWMDWTRYAESHGSEGDPRINFAWRYRDYLIRALNDDVPVDQLVREHIAGDQLENPRMNEGLGINESMIGVSQYRFVLHGFAPTDAHDELVRFTDNQIDVVSKAFLGLTVSCARCHDHKFDAISQKDFYSLMGIMVSSRPTMLTIDTPDRRNVNRDELARLKPRIRNELADVWLQSLDSFPGRLVSLSESPVADAARDDRKKRKQNKRERNFDRPTHPLFVWLQLQSLKGKEFADRWNELQTQFRESQQRLQQRQRVRYPVQWDLTEQSEAETWFAHGTGTAGQTREAGHFHVLPAGQRAIDGIHPAGVFSNAVSDKHNGVFMSPKFPIEAKRLFVRIAGKGDAKARYCVQHYPRRGTVYPVQTLSDGEWKWVAWDMTYWQGDQAHFEITTAADQPIEGEFGNDRSWFGISDLVYATQEQLDGEQAPRDEAAEFFSPLFAVAKPAPKNRTDVVRLYQTAIVECVEAWRDARLTDDQARFLDGIVRSELLPNSLDASPPLRALVAQYRRLEDEIPVPQRVPGILDAESVDQPLLTRGDHKNPADPVPRRFLEAIDDTPYQTQASGRKELAEDLLRPDNPLTARVLVNRVWHHLFGRGIVATPDNFGRLGSEPTHPELLDWLATRFIEDEWSLKRLVRMLVMSHTFQAAGEPSLQAAEIDPDNLLLSHWSVRRLDAESIRDSLVSATGTLDLTPFGPAAARNARRRSVYLPVIRNSMIPLLSVFDMPTPFSTQGRRDSTNVPDQSLTLMNDPEVETFAKDFAGRITREDASHSAKSAVTRMFVVALGREPTEVELTQAIEFVTQGSDPENTLNSASLAELAMVIFNLKEFIYVR